LDFPGGDRMNRPRLGTQKAGGIPLREEWVPLMHVYVLIDLTKSDLAPAQGKIEPDADQSLGSD
jgi:hypothetical protein